MNSKETNGTLKHDPLMEIIRLAELLPEKDRKVLEEPLFRLSEWRRAAKARELIPETIRIYYEANYRLDDLFGNERAYKFVGFACSACGKWLEFGHKSNCPLEAIGPKGVDWKALNEDIQKVRI